VKVGNQPTTNPTPQLPSSYLVKQLQEALRLRLDQVTRGFGLTTRQYTTLSVLARYPRISSAQLARHTFVSPQAANQMVATLEQKGLLRRSVDPSNRRCIEVELTPAGVRARARCDAHIEELEAEVFRGIDGEAHAQFRRVLQTCLQTISTMNARAEATVSP
jgi:DNA-binding MarR family transcriptional regulator